MQVKVHLFKSFCIFYNIALWENYHVYCLNKLATAYVKCTKMFFGFHKYSSVTSMLLQLGLPSFDTVLHNARICFVNSLHLLDNNVVAVSCKLWFHCLHAVFFFFFNLCVCVFFYGSLWCGLTQIKNEWVRNTAKTWQLKQESEQDLCPPWTFTEARSVKLEKKSFVETKPVGKVWG